MNQIQEDPCTGSPLTVTPITPQTQPQVLQDNSANNTGKSYDIRLKENFKLFISGPSRCGKTFFVSDLLDNIEGFTKVPPQTIICLLCLQSMATQV